MTSYYSRTVHEGVAAGESTFGFDFEYTDPSEVRVLVNNDDDQPYTLTSTATLSLSTPTSENNSKVVIYRRTDLSRRKVDFKNASQLTEADLDTSAQQVFQASQEALDNTSASAGTVESLTARAETASTDAASSAEDAYVYERLAMQHKDDAEDAADRARVSTDTASSYAAQVSVRANATAEDRSAVTQMHSEVMNVRSETIGLQDSINTKLEHADSTMTNVQSLVDAAHTETTELSNAVDAVESRLTTYEGRLDNADATTTAVLTAVADAEGARDTAVLNANAAAINATNAASSESSAASSAAAAASSATDAANIAAGMLPTQASDLAFTPSSAIVATDVQAAIAEVRNDTYVPQADAGEVSAFTNTNKYVTPDLLPYAFTAMGIGATTARVIPGGDANNARETGFWRVSSGDLNLPVSAASNSQILVLASTSNYCTQVYFSRTGEWQFQRTYEVGTWSDWMQYARVGPHASSVNAADADTIEHNGWYYKTSSGNVNWPSGASQGSSLLHIGGNTGNATQLVIDSNSATMWIRFKWSGVWDVTGWTRMADQEWVNSTLQTVGGISSLAYLTHVTANTSITAGSNYAGSSLRYGSLSTAGLNSNQSSIRMTTGATPSGTWKALGTATAAAGYYSSTLFVRIA